MQDIIEQLRNIPVTCISDALEGLKHLSPGIKPLKEEYKICGSAVTVKVPAGDNAMVLAAMKEAKTGDILVVDAEGARYRSFAGDFVIGLAKTLGLGGIVADGVVRDIIGVKALNFPVFCLGTTVACSKKFGHGSINQPISCGGIAVLPGDIIVGDADGVVVIPAHQVQEVLLRAKNKMDKDKVRADQCLANRETALAYINCILANE